MSDREKKMAEMKKTAFTITLNNSLDELAKIEHAVDRISDSVCCSQRRLCEVNLILEELFTNIVNHGFDNPGDHQVEMAFEWDGRNLTIMVEDDGKPFNPIKAKSPDTRCELADRLVGGLGVHLVKHFCDGAHYFRRKDRNVVVLKKALDHDKKNQACHLKDN